jgi:hypothetical protein
MGVVYRANHTRFVRRSNTVTQLQVEYGRYCARNERSHLRRCIVTWSVLLSGAEVVQAGFGVELAAGLRSGHLSLQRGRASVRTADANAISPGLIFSRAKTQAGKCCRRWSRRFEDDWRITMAILRLAKFCW